MTRSLSLLALPVALLTLLSSTAVAQQPVAGPDDDQQLEEQFIQSRADNGDSHASGQRPELGPVILGNPAQSVVVLRVGLLATTFNANGTVATEFSTFSHAYADISHTAGDVHVLDKATGKQIVAIEPGTIVHVAHDGTGFQVSIDGADYGTYDGPIFFRPTDPTNLFRVESIRRTYSGTYVPSYHGAIEIARGTPSATPAGRVNVVNVVELEDYVPGVVANESIASFQMEALKAQAVASRGYAVANIGRYVRQGYPFDIVDSTSSQVYRGVISEHPRAVQAATETIGLVASYNGQIISAMYSSSMGGHTENVEWIYPSPSNQLPGTNVTPYLRGVYDGDGATPDLTTEAGRSAFWTVPRPDAFDDCGRVGNRFSRWRLVLTAAQIKARLSGRSVVISGTTAGPITDVTLPMLMGASARAAVARITFTTGVAEVRGWDNLRYVLGRTAVTTPAMCTASAIAANFVLNNPSVISQTKNADGTVKDVTAWGGGWGHNVGLSQYGSNGRAKAGQNFLQILKGYYSGIDVGSYPIDIGREPGSGTPTLRQQFYAANARGTLVIRADGMKKLVVHVNGLADLSFDADQLASGVVTADLSPYLTAGLNTVQYNPVGRDGTATVMVAVE